MQMKTDGLIIRDLNVGENDRIVTILTREHGIIQASARGARRVKSHISTATRLFCYSDFTLFKGRDIYIIDSATPKEFFLGIDKDLAGLSLSQYLAQLSAFLTPQEEKSEDYLRLMLNSLNFIRNGEKPLLLIKSAFEIRILTLSGYMPDLVACKECGAYESDVMYLDPVEGTLICSECKNRLSISGQAQSNQDYLLKNEFSKLQPLSKGALAALRHMVYSEFPKLFSFTLSEKALESLSDACEKYLLCCVDKTFPTLDFFHAIYKK